jgi:hypothetical protein
MYEACCRHYRALASAPFCASLYQGNYFNLPGAPAVPGLDESVAHYVRLAQARDRASFQPSRLSVAAISSNNGSG